MKGESEQLVAAAIRATGAYAYKPPDDARNRKPCDFFVWQKAPRSPEDGMLYEPAASTWIEVKMTAAASLTPNDIRPSQRAGVALAMTLGIPYWFVVMWSGDNARRPRGHWTAIRADQPLDAALWRTSLSYDDEGWTRAKNIQTLMVRVFDAR